MTILLEIEQATKWFSPPEGRIITALDNVSLSVGRNEFLALLGPSDCGKTTLLRVISGFEDLQSGSIRIDGEDMTNRRPVNMVFQKYALFPHLSVARNVAYSLKIARISKKQIEAQVGDMLALVGLGGFGDRKINQLSGEQQQRVALARSLIARPKTLLLDEPLSALDKNLRHKMQQLGPPEDLYRRPANAFVAEFLGESNIFEGHVADCSPSEAQSIAVPKEALRKGPKIKLLVRPEDLSIAANDLSGLRFNGAVAETYYVGSDYQLVVTTETTGPLRATTREFADTLVIGSNIALHVPLSAIHVIPKQAA